MIDEKYADICDRIEKNEPKARDDLVKMFIFWAMKCARIFFNSNVSFYMDKFGTFRGVDLEDFRGAAFYGLVIAARRFNPKKFDPGRLKYVFFKFSKRCMREQMLKMLKNTGFYFRATNKEGVEGVHNFLNESIKEEYFSNAYIKEYNDSLEKIRAACYECCSLRDANIFIRYFGIGENLESEEPATGREIANEYHMPVISVYKIKDRVLARLRERLDKSDFI